MSKTLKTRPIAVRIMDPRDHAVGLEETHHHEKGFCDIPPRNIKAVLERDEALEDGTYEYARNESCNYDFSYVGSEICACHKCAAQTERKTTTRKTRHKIKSTLASETKQVKAMMRDGVPEEDELESLDSPWVVPKPVY